MKYNILGVASFIIVIYGIFSAINSKNIFWYSYFLLGGTFFIAYINFNLKNDSLIKRFRKNKLKEIKNYFYYIFIAMLIEIIGRHILNLWSYPNYNTLNIIINVFIIGYPMALFFVYESFILINKYFSFNISIVICALINAFLHEIPNKFANEWTYNIPRITFEIFGLNILVIIGWFILIIIPLITNGKIKIIKKGVN